MQHIEDHFIEKLKTHEGILKKMLYLYADGSENKKDLQQEMILQLWHAYKTFKGHSKFSTWMYRVCLNTALNYNKSQKKHSYENLDSAHTLNYTEEHGGDKEILNLLIRTLDDVDKMIITLYLEGFKNNEISEITGINTNNVNVKIHRIKAKFMKHIKSMRYEI